MADNRVGNTTVSRKRRLIPRKRRKKLWAIGFNYSWPIEADRYGSAGWTSATMRNRQALLKGLISGTPNALKSETFLVTTVRPCTFAVAAIIASS